MARQLITAFLLALCVFAGSWVLLQPGFFRAHDFVHAARIAEMSRALEAGHIPPRWSANFGYGYGMPLFSFYAPLPFIVGAFFLQLLTVVAVLKLLIIIATIGTVVGMYLFAREYFSRTASVLAAFAATMAPYRAVNIFVRGALSEVWGMAWTPLVFLGVARISRARGGFLILSLSVAGMALSHNLVTLMAILASSVWGLLLIYFEVQSKKSAWKEGISRSVRLFLGYLTGFGLASWYLIPSVAEKNFTKLDATILTGYFDFHVHFLYIRQLLSNAWGYGGSQWGPDDGISFFLGYGQLLAIFVCVYLFFKSISLGKNLWLREFFKRQYLAWITLLVLTLCLSLTLTHSAPIWDSVFFLQYLQFPWRWLSVSTVLLAFLVAWSVDSVHSKLRRSLYCVLMIVLLIRPITNFQPEAFLSNADDLYYIDSTRIQTQMSEILPDYIPVALNTTQLRPSGDPLSDTDGLVVAQHVIDRPHEHLYLLELQRTQPVAFSIAYFPGWRAEIDGIQTLVEPNADGLLSLSIPEGSHQVGLYFSESPVRKIADVLSVVSALGLITYWVRSKRSPTS